MMWKNDRGLPALLAMLLIMALIAGCAGTVSAPPEPASEQQTEPAEVEDTEAAPAAEEVGQQETEMAAAEESAADSANLDGADITRRGKPREELVFYFASPLVANPFWDQVQAGWEDACAFYGVQCEFVGPTLVDINEQLQYFEAAMAQGVDGIVTDPLNPAQFETIFQQATEMGIPVIAMDSDAPDSARIAYYGSENKNAGKLLAETLVELTDGQGKIGILTGVLDAENLHERIEGMEEVFAEHPGMEIVAMEGDDYLIDVGIQKVTAMFQANPEMNTIVGLHSNTPSAVGSALNELGLAGEVVATGWDASPEGIDYVKSGVLDALLVQRPYDMGYWSLKSLVTISSGFQQDVAGANDTGMIVVTEDNVDTFDQR